MLVWFSAVMLVQLASPVPVCTTPDPAHKCFPPPADESGFLRDLLAPISVTSFLTSYFELAPVSFHRYPTGSEDIDAELGMAMLESGIIDLTDLPLPPSIAKIQSGLKSGLGFPIATFLINSPTLIGTHTMLLDTILVPIRGNNRVEICPHSHSETACRETSLWPHPSFACHSQFLDPGTTMYIPRYSAIRVSESTPGDRLFAFGVEVIQIQDSGPARTLPMWLLQDERGLATKFESVSHVLDLSPNALLKMSSFKGAVHPKLSCGKVAKFAQVKEIQVPCRSNQNGLSCALIDRSLGGNIRPAFCSSTTGSCLACDGCRCLPGFLEPLDFIAPRCLDCPSNTYKELAGSSPCLLCPANSTSPPRSPSRGSCLCDPGFFGNLSITPSCTACAAGKFSALPGQASCLTCPPNSRSDDTLTGCLCEPGFFETTNSQNETFCIGCERGKFKNTVGNDVCADCPSDSSSPPNSTSQNQCRCLQGYISKPVGQGFICEDANECEVANGNCNRTSRCVNFAGSYRCEQCPIGHSANGTECLEQCSANSVLNCGSDNAIDLVDFHNLFELRVDETKSVKVELCEAAGSFRRLSDCLSASNDATQRTEIPLNCVDNFVEITDGKFFVQVDSNSPSVRVRVLCVGSHNNSVLTLAVAVAGAGAGVTGLLILLYVWRAKHKPTPGPTKMAPPNRRPIQERDTSTLTKIDPNELRRSLSKVDDSQEVPFGVLVQEL